MSELLYHYENPKFAGLPWSCDQKTIRRKKMIRRKCIKKNFSLPDVRNETARLRKESPGARWSFLFCATCKGFHVCRMKRAV